MGITGRKSVRSAAQGGTVSGEPESSLALRWTTFFTNLNVKYSTCIMGSN
jgi:hypothetical protein